MKFKITFLWLSVLLLVVACKTNPFTGEKNLNFVSNDQLFPASFEQYNQFLTEAEVVTGTEESRKVKRLGEDIVTAAERFLNANGYQGFMNDFEWEFNLVKDDQANAFAMPGGKVVIYTGILDEAQNTNGLATIMAHEIAHALADHGAQRMSAAQLQQVGGAVVGVAASGRSQGTQQIIAQAYGLGTTVGGMLPFSRGHEAEADRIGLTIMAIAGYDPREAPELWKRMQASSSGEAPPEFLSTHPSTQTRINNLTEWAPEAIAEAKKYGTTSFK